MSRYRQLFLDSVRTCIGRPYRWGGQTYGEGYDCSGLVVACLRDAGGEIPDMTAQQLADYFHRHHKLIGLAEPGDLLFYGPDAGQIDHVMIVLDVWERSGSDWPMMILAGARGGDRRCVTPSIAYVDNAFVDVVRGDYWRENFRFILGID